MAKSSTLIDELVRRPIDTRLRHARWGWVSYSVSDNIYAVNVPLLYMSVWVVSDLAAPATWYGVAVSASSVLVALTVPLLCSRSDRTGRRHVWVVAFTALCVVMTLAIGVAARSVRGASATMHGWPGFPLLIVLASFTLAQYGYQAALPFYHAMLGSLTPPSKRGGLSGAAVAASFIGTLVGALLVAPFATGRFPATSIPLPRRVLQAMHALVPFTSTNGLAAVFAPTAILVALFAIPFFVWSGDRPRGVSPRPAHTLRPLTALRRDARELIGILRGTTHAPDVRRFLAASLLYQDATGTIVAFMAVYAVRVVHLAPSDEVRLFAVLSIPAIVGSYGCGWLVDRVGPRRAMLSVLGAWVVLFTILMTVTSLTELWIVGALIGLVFGGLSVVERPLLLHLAPGEETGRLFGLLFLSGSAATFVGPIIWGQTVDRLSPAFGPGVAYRVALATMVAVLAAAFWVIRGIPQWTDRDG